MRRNRAIALAVVGIALVPATAGCGGSSTTTTAVNPNAAEQSPPGDIPDNQAFVAYGPKGAGFTVKVPEGWSQSKTAGGTEFTDKLNSVTVESTSAPQALTPKQAQGTLVPELAKSVKGFANPKVTTVSRSGEQAVLVTYEAQGKPDPVTGKAVTDAVERYVFFKNGTQLTLVLSGPQGADNVDPWRTISDSVKWG